MNDSGDLKNVTELIHLTMAPIFLLTAVAGTLTVFAGRLARIVDRGRALERGAAPNRQELLLLERRARLIYRALTLGVCAAICVSLLMGLVFAGTVFDFDSTRAVALLFMAALLIYTAALLCLLREVFLAVGSFRLGIQLSAPKSEA